MNLGTSIGGGWRCTGDINRVQDGPNLILGEPRNFYRWGFPGIFLMNILGFLSSLLQVLDLLSATGIYLVIHTIYLYLCRVYCVCKKDEKIDKIIHPEIILLSSAYFVVNM